MSTKEANFIRKTNSKHLLSFGFYGVDWLHIPLGQKKETVGNSDNNSDISVEFSFVPQKKKSSSNELIGRLRIKAILENKKTLVKYIDLPKNAGLPCRAPAEIFSTVPAYGFHPWRKKGVSMQVYFLRHDRGKMVELLIRRHRVI